MRTRTLRLAILGYQAVLTYLFVIQTLAVTGIGRLPLSFVPTMVPQLFLVQAIILTLQFPWKISFVSVKTRHQGNMKSP